MVVLVISKKGNSRLRRLLNSWHNPGKNQRQVEEEVFLEKLSPTAYLVKDTYYSLRLFGHLMWKNLGEVRLFNVEEFTKSDLDRMIGEHYRAGRF